VSATSQVTDFSDLYTDLLNRVRAATGVTATDNQAKRYINTALQDLVLGYGEKFPWAQREGVLRTKAPYTTGTVAVTVGSTTITGTSTAWNTNDDYGVANMVAGGKFTVNGTDTYEIASVASDTSSTLTTAYIGDTDTSTTYTYYEDDYALHADFYRPLDYRSFDASADIPLIDPMEFRRRYPRNISRGRPRVATLISKNPSGDTTVRTRVRFYQPPDAAYLIPYSFITNKLAYSSSGTAATALSADADEPIVPLQYRHVLVLHALISWYRDKKDDARSQEVKAEWVELMKRITGDSQIGDARPRIQPRVWGVHERARRPWSGTGHHYVVGTAWDEMRQ